MAPDHSPVQGCWRKPPPLPNFFQVSSKLWRLLKPLKPTQKHQPDVFTFSNSNERLYKLNAGHIPLKVSLAAKAHGHFKRRRCPWRSPAPNPMQKTVILHSCWFTVLLIFFWHLLNPCGQATLRVDKNQSQGRSWACNHHGCHMVLSYDSVTSLSQRRTGQGIL